MNDDARFFFYLSGFVGFLLFFIVGILYTQDFIVVLAQSSFGCLFFAICGRFLLSYVLNGIILDSSPPQSGLPSSEKAPSSIIQDPTKLATIAMNEASTKAKHLVEAQV